jgi:hypothetical protein
LQDTETVLEALWRALPSPPTPLPEGRGE